MNIITILIIYTLNWVLKLIIGWMFFHLTYWIFLDPAQWVMIVIVAVAATSTSIKLSEDVNQLKWERTRNQAKGILDD